MAYLGKRPGDTFPTANAITNTLIADNAVTEAKMADDAIGQAELKSVVTLLIINSAGTTVKTLYGACA